MPINPHKSVAVITATVGRKELERAIKSVLNQTYPCTHYVFIDGKEFANQARNILQKYPNVIAIYLPMNTGANGWLNSTINAISAFLVKEDIICYLDDDNWYEPFHVENCINTFNTTNADYVYTLRNLYKTNNIFICQDLTESIGFYKNKIIYPYDMEFTFNNERYSITLTTSNTTFIDVNCYAIKKDVAMKYAQYWNTGIKNDRNLYLKLSNSNLKCACTNTFSVNYILQPTKHISSQDIQSLTKLGMSIYDIYELVYSIKKEENKLNFKLLNEQYPWENGSCKYINTNECEKIEKL